MGISAQCLLEKISVHYQCQLTNLKQYKSDNLMLLIVTPDIVPKKVKNMKDNKSLIVDGIKII